MHGIPVQPRSAARFWQFGVACDARGERWKMSAILSGRASGPEVGNVIMTQALSVSPHSQQRQARRPRPRRRRARRRPRGRLRAQAAPTDRSLRVLVPGRPMRARSLCPSACRAKSIRSDECSVVLLSRRSTRPSAREQRQFTSPPPPLHQLRSSRAHSSARSHSARSRLRPADPAQPSHRPSPIDKPPARNSLCDPSPGGAPAGSARAQLSRSRQTHSLALRPPPAVRM